MVNNKAAFVVAIFCAALVSHFSWAQDESYRTPKWLQQSFAARAAQSTNRLIVKFKHTPNATLTSGAVRAKALTASAKQSLQHVRSLGEQLELMALPASVSNAEARRLAQQLQADPDVEYAEPDYKMFPARTPSDPGVSPGIDFDGSANTVLVSQWYLSNSVGGINAPAAWDITTGSTSTIIAVVDTGILRHLDLSGREVAGYDFIGQDPDGSFDTANDGNGRDNDATDPGNWITLGEARTGNFASCGQVVSDFHGTHVAGIVAANANNGNIAGIDWAAKVMSVRVLGKCGGYTSDIVDGMRWSVGIAIAGVPANLNRANIVNLSLGIASETNPPACTNTMQNAINDVLARGASVVAAAGNGGEDAANSIPANCAGVINVGATLIDGRFASSYSNFGSQITLSAPGGLIVDIPSDFGQNGILSINDLGTTTPFNDNKTAALFGTSFSSAMVSGVASLMLAVNPNLTPAQIKAILQSTARLPSRPSETGLDCGLIANHPCQQYVVDAAAAVTAASNLVLLKILDSNDQAVSLLSFGARALNDPSPAQTLIVRNSSATSIQIENVLITGAHSDDFAASTTCANASPNPFPFSLPAGADCDIAVTFTAKGNDVRTADIVVVSNVDLPVAVTGAGPASPANNGDGSKGGGGGCTIASAPAFDPALILLIAASALLFARRRYARR